MPARRRRRQNVQSRDGCARSFNVSAYGSFAQIGRNHRLPGNWNTGGAAPLRECVLSAHSSDWLSRVFAVVGARPLVTAADKRRVGVPEARGRKYGDRAIGEAHKRLHAPGDGGRQSPRPWRRAYGCKSEPNHAGDRRCNQDHPGHMGWHPWPNVLRQPDGHSRCRRRSTAGDRDDEEWALPWARIVPQQQDPGGRMRDDERHQRHPPQPWLFGIRGKNDDAARRRIKGKSESDRERGNLKHLSPPFTAPLPGIDVVATG